MKRSRTLYEVAAVVATAILHPVFENVLHQRALFIGLALAGWGLYLGMRVRREENALANRGIRMEGLGPAFAAASVFGAAALVAMGIIAQARHCLVFHWQMLLLLALYPLWGLVQQLLVQGIFVISIVGTGTGRWAKLGATALAALLFGAVHLPEMKLAAATCLLGVVFTLIYLRWRNLWPLGLYHGWLGVFFYYWVLGRDAWAEVFRTDG